MSCPICNKRRVKRFCQARGESICPVCCGTEREVSIDCPLDCSYLVSSRTYDLEHKTVDEGKIPFPDVKVAREFPVTHAPLLTALLTAVWRYAREHRQVVDLDVIASFQALATTYRTLASGLYYEEPPEYLYRRELYNVLKTALDEFKQAEIQKLGMATTRESDIRDALVFLAQLASLRENGRPKGRAFLALIRSQIAPDETAKAASNIVLLS